MPTVTAMQGDTVDELCFRHLGTTAGGVVESTYSMNFGLAELGPVLPAGTQVELPEKPVTQTNISTLQLF
jgi:phage tail protein X